MSMIATRRFLLLYTDLSIELTEPALIVQAIGVDLDLVEKGLGIRSRRYAM